MTQLCEKELGTRLTSGFALLQLKVSNVDGNYGNANVENNSREMVVFFSKGYFVVWPCVPHILSVAAAVSGYTPSYPSEGQGDCAGCHSNHLSVHHDDSPGHLATKDRNTTH